LVALLVRDSRETLKDLVALLVRDSRETLKDLVALLVRKLRRSTMTLTVMRLKTTDIEQPLVHHMIPQGSPEKDLDYLASEIKSRLARTHKYEEKAREMGISAGLMLIEAKEELRKRAATSDRSIRYLGWEEWLAEKEIPARTARRWMAEAKDPEKSQKRREEQHRRNQEVWKAKKEHEDLKEFRKKQEEFASKPQEERDEILQGMVGDLVKDCEISNEFHRVQREVVYQINCLYTIDPLPVGIMQKILEVVKPIVTTALRDYGVQP
jgi:hypothetical protein